MDSSARAGDDDHSRGDALVRGHARGRASSGPNRIIRSERVDFGPSRHDGGVDGAGWRRRHGANVRYTDVPSCRSLIATAALKFAEPSDPTRASSN